MFKKGFLVACLILSGYVHAQESLPHGRFLADTMKIGEPVPYVLSYTYDASKDVIFPDSLFDFQPFELYRKEYFPTTTVNGISTDSALYYLSYFELDTVQLYALPVFEVINGDSSRLFARRDTIFLKQLVTEVPDSVSVEAMPLKENTTYINVPLAFNYPYLLIGIGVLVIILILVLVFFGKLIYRSWKVYWLRRRHQKFTKQFDMLAQEKGTDFRSHAEKVLIYWKKYLQQLESYPYTSLTTKELITTHPDTQLSGALNEIDAAMYNPRRGELNPASFDRLKIYADDRFEKRINILQNG